MAERARGKTSAKIINRRGREIEFENEFDAVVSFGQSFNYIKKEKEMRKTLKNCFNALKDGGKLLVDVMTDLGEVDSSRKRTHELDSLSFSVQETFTHVKDRIFNLKFNYRISKSEDSADITENHEIRSWRLEKLKSLVDEFGFSEIDEKNIYEPVHLFHLSAEKRR